MTRAWTLVLLSCACTGPSNPCAPDAAMPISIYAPVQVKAGFDLSRFETCTSQCASDSCSAGAECGTVHTAACAVGFVCVPNDALECADGGRIAKLESCPPQFACFR